MKHRIRDSQTANLTCPTDVFEVTSAEEPWRWETRTNDIRNTSRYVSRYVCSLVRTWTGTGHPKMGINPERPTICFTICLFISQICFTICLFISPDLDGHRAPKNRASTPRDPRYVSRYVCSLVRYVSRYVCSLVRTWTGTGHPKIEH